MMDLDRFYENLILEKIEEISDGDVGRVKEGVLEVSAALIKQQTSYEGSQCGQTMVGLQERIKVTKAQGNVRLDPTEINKLIAMEKDIILRQQQIYGKLLKINNSSKDLSNSEE